MKKSQEVYPKSSLYSHLLAIGSLAGTIIGLGMFGIPYVAVQAGTGLTLFYLLILGAIVVIVHLMYLEVTLRTNETHRLAGYAGIYFGGRWKFISSVVTALTLWGALLIYTIVGGEFLNIVLESLFDFGNAVFASSLAFFAVSAYVVARPPRTIGKIEALFTLGIVVVVFWFFARGLWGGQIHTSNFSGIDWPNWLAPYGVILFALSGISMIPSLENILSREIQAKQKIHFGKIGIFGTLIPIIIYAIFMITVVGISGVRTSEEALRGLEATLGNGYVIIGAIIGFFALFTSFIALGDELKRVFWNDYHLPYGLSLFLALVVPLALFLINLAGFTQIMNFLGAILGVYAYVLIILLFYKAKKTGDPSVRQTEMPPLFSFNFPKIIAGIIIFIFIAGWVYNIISLVL